MTRDQAAELALRSIAECKNVRPAPVLSDEDVHSAGPAGCALALNRPTRRSTTPEWTVWPTGKNGLA